MKTDRYRVRQGFRGNAILQRLHDYPSLIAGHVDASVRQFVWVDVRFEDLENIQFRPFCCKEPQ